MRIFFATLFSLALSPTSFADAEGPLKDPHHKGLVSSLNLGIRYSSVLQNRGVISYNDFQIDPVVAIFLFDDRLEFLGDSIGFRDFFFKDQLRLRTRLVSISAKPLFPNHSGGSRPASERADTYEWANRIEWFAPGYNAQYKTELDLEYSKDFDQSFGNYLNLSGKLKLFDFRLPKAKTLVEPNLYATIGWGDANHNAYFYGPSADSPGFNNLSYGVWFAFTEEADRYYPIVQLTHFEAIGQFRDAAYAANSNDGWLFSFIATGGLLE